MDCLKTNVAVVPGECKTVMKTCSKRKLSQARNTEKTNIYVLKTVKSLYLKKIIIYLRGNFTKNS